jgi:phage-related protein
LTNRIATPWALDLMRVQFRWPVGMPLCRPMGQGLWEVRTFLPSQRIARTLFSIHESRIVLLHGFIKKSQKTPDAELAARAPAQTGIRTIGGSPEKEE